MKYPATFLNTLIATVIGTLGIIVIASMGGYKMARVKTRYSRFCFLFCIAPMMIPFQSFMLTLVNVATTLHINGKIWGLAIIYWGLGAPMSIFLYQGFAKGIPLELEDFLLPLLMLGGRKSSKTLQLAAYSFMGQYKMEWQNIMSAAILIIIPALILYLIFQKSIIKGVVAGAVKG